jgi:hypothetical protein
MPVRPERLIRLAGGLLLAGALSLPASAAPKDDPHYNSVGFFDIHVCHWPDRPLFYLMLFSTTRFADVERVEVFYPDGRPLAPFDMNRFRIVKRDGKPEKRVFMTNVPLPADAPAGWYRATIRLKDGSTHAARDRVEILRLPMAAGLQPAPDSENIPMPAQLSWQPVPGAKHYQVYIWDKWRGEKELFRSKIISEPRLALPPGLLQRGGSYKWRVHARDVNEHVELGDFNHGSLSPFAVFTIADEPPAPPAARVPAR